MVSWGEFLWDLFPSGACPGGAPANVAIHLAQLGVETALVTRLGTDSMGEEAKIELAERGVETSALQFDTARQTGRVGIEVVNNEPRYTLHPGAWQAIAWQAEARRLVLTCRAFCYGTLAQESREGLESWRKAIENLSDGTLIVCDPNLRGGRIDPPLVLEHLRAATLVKVNDEEVKVLQSTYGCDDAVQWLLRDLDVHMVAHTHGSAGITLCTQAEQVHRPGIVAMPGGDNVGAGDACTAVLIAGMLHNLPLETMAQAANLYGSFVAGCVGATPLPSPAILRELELLLGH